MKSLKLFFILILFFESVGAKSSDADRAELILLMKERKELYDKYSASLSSKSGFFGNRTKNDLKESQGKLLEIIAVDNKIMNALNRTLDFRNFEKQSLAYDVNSFEERIRNLNTLNDTLNKQNLKFVEENKVLQKSVKKNRLYLILLLVPFFVFIIFRLKRYFQSL